MKAKELIELLQTANPEAQVIFERHVYLTRPRICEYDITGFNELVPKSNKVVLEYILREMRERN